MIQVQQTTSFTKWQSKLRDQKARAAMILRMKRMAEGLFGDHKRFDGLIEFRIDVGAGYRMYAKERGPEIVLLLVGGDKSTQDQDIVKAKKIVKEMGL